jgi:hypothetical protein
MRYVFDLVDNLRATVLAARQVQDPNNTLAQLFPYQTTDDLRYRLLQRQRVDVAGSVRAYSTPSREIRRGGVVEVKGELPAVSAITTFTESDLQRARLLAGIAADGQALQNDVDAAAAEVATAVDNTYEILRGSVLVTGKLSIDNGEVIQQADYGVPTGNLPAAQIPWTDVENAKVIDDLLGWQATYRRRGRGNPGRTTLTQRTLSLMRRNAQVRQLLGTTAGGTPLVTLDQLNAFLTSEGMPAITADSINERVIEGRRVIPDGAFVWTPNPATGGTFGNTLLGASEQGLQLLRAGVLENAAEVPGVSVATLVEDHPPARMVNADSIGLPVVNTPETLFSATVYPYDYAVEEYV